MAEWQDGRMAEGVKMILNFRKQVWPKWQNGRMAEGVKIISNFRKQVWPEWQDGRMPFCDLRQQTTTCTKWQNGWMAGDGRLVS